MLEKIYIIVEKGFTGHRVVQSHEQVISSVSDGDLVYEVREAFKVVKQEVKLQEISQKDLNLEDHNYK